MSTCRICGDVTARGERCRSCAQFRRQQGRDRTEAEVCERRYIALVRRQELRIVANYRHVT